MKCQNISKLQWYSKSKLRSPLHQACVRPDADVPPSPDETSAKANQAEYSSPGEHPSQGKDDRMKPDMDNANPAVAQQVTDCCDSCHGMLC